MAQSKTLKEELKQLGWHLTEEGLARCQALCQQKGLEPTTKNVEKTALDLDLRSIGEQALSDDLARNTKHEVEGPLVLQVQRVRNVALPSTKQFSSGQSSRRLVRVQLTDGRVSLAGVEMEGAIANLSTQTPPGTKVLLLQKTETQRGFLLLGRHSLKILGGHVEHLVQKWNLTKIVPEEMGRSAGGDSDAPQFIQFGSAKPSGVKAELARGQQPGRKTTGGSGVSTREAVVSSMTREDDREKMELPKSEEEERRKAPLRENQSRDEGRGRGAGQRQQHTRNTEGRNGRNDRGSGTVEGNERPSGRGRRGGRREEYDQGRRTESSMLSDWLEQKLTVSSTTVESQDPMESGGQRESREDDYWEEVWAYQESLAMAESERQWRREEREREERATGMKGELEGNRHERRGGERGGRQRQWGREREMDYGTSRSHRGRYSGRGESQYDGGRRNESQYDGRRRNESQYDGGRRNEAQYDGGRRNEAQYDGGRRNEAQYDGGRRNEARRQGSREQFGDRGSEGWGRDGGGGRQRRNRRGDDGDRREGGGGMNRRGDDGASEQSRERQERTGRERREGPKSEPGSRHVQRDALSKGLSENSGSSKQQNSANWDLGTTGSHHSKERESREVEGVGAGLGRGRGVRRVNEGERIIGRGRGRGRGIVGEGGNGVGRGGEREERHSTPEPGKGRDGPTLQEQQLVPESDPGMAVEKAERDGASESSSASESAPPSSSSGQYNWGWVQKGAPFKARKIVL